METRFVNRFTLTPTDKKEYVMRVLAQPVITWGPVVGLVGIASYFLMEGPVRFVMGTAGLIALITSFLTPLLSLKEFSASMDLDPSETTIFFGEKIRVESRASHIDLDYQQFKGMKETPSLYCLQLRSKGSLLVKKNHFIQGREEDFPAFIEEKIQRKEN